MLSALAATALALLPGSLATAAPALATPALAATPAASADASPARGPATTSAPAVPALTAARRAAAAAAADPARPASAPDSCPGYAIVIPVGASIQAAVDAAAPAAVFCIAAGVHRLQSVVPRSGQSFFGQPGVLGQSGSILSGAATLPAFRAEAGLWRADAPDPDPEGSPHGACAPGRASCARPAALFLDGTALRQDDARDGLQPGHFFYDRDAGQVVLAEDPAGRVAEWATTAHAFAGPADHVTIAGLAIEKYASPAQSGAIWPAGRGWTERRLEVRDNTGVGLVVGSDGAILDCDVHHNGELGIGVGGATGVLIRGNEVWANNTRGFDAEWEAGGIKVAVSRDVSFEANLVHHNAGPGLWCDESCQGVLIEGNIVEYNDGAGIFYEISTDAVIRGNELRENGQAAPPWFWGADIQVAASARVDVDANTVVVRPDGRAIMLIDQNRRRADGDYYANRDDTVHANRVTFLGHGTAGGVSDAGPLAANYRVIETGNNSFDSDAFLGPADAAPVFLWGETAVGFAGFRSLGQERHGSLAGPAQASVPVPAPAAAPRRAPGLERTARPAASPRPQAHDPRSAASPAVPDPLAPRPVAAPLPGRAPGVSVHPG